MSMLYIVFAIPGVFIEIRVRIVRNDKSLRRPHKYWMKIDRARFIMSIPGKKVDLIRFIDLEILAPNYA
jgi:hypothetical protein